MDLHDAVTQLYGVHRDAFLTTRRSLAAQARAEGDSGLAKAVESVRKPTAAAWAVNQLVRRRPDDVDRLLALAQSLHEAQEKMDGPALKSLGRQRSALVDQLVQSTAEAATDAGGSVSGPTAAQVRETLVAALATTAAAEAVASGQLTRALSYAGFGDVDLSEATAAPPPARRPALRVIAGDGASSARADGASGQTERQPEAPAEPDPELLRRLQTAEKRSRETMSAAAQAGEALTRATEALESLDTRIAQLDADLKAARAEREGLVRAHKDALATSKVAERSVRAALAEVDQIRARLPDTDD